MAQLFAALSRHFRGMASDIGVGTDFIKEGLVKRGLRVNAIDQSEAMLEEKKSETHIPHIKHKNHLRSSPLVVVI